MRLLKKYWDHLLMVTREGGYFGRTFQGHRGITQGDSLSPAIFNVVVYVVHNHWVSMVSEAEQESGL